MHPQSENLKKLLHEVIKKKGIGIDHFFTEIWQSGVLIPSAEILAISEELYQWLQPLQLQQPKNFALSLFTVAIGEYHNGKYEASLKDGADAQKLFAEMKDEDGIQISKIIQGSVYRTLGDIELAVKNCLEGYRHLIKTGVYPIMRLFAEYDLAEMYSETGRLDESLQFYESALIYIKSIGNQHMIARILLGIGVVYQRQMKYALALEYFNRAMEICDTTNSLPVKARLLTDIGSYYFEMGDYTAAIKYQKEALQIREELKIPNAPITNYIHIGNIYRKQGKLDEAIEILNRSLLIAEEIQVKPKIFQIHSLLSDIYEAKGEPDRALFHQKAYHKIREEVQHEDNEKKIKNLHLIFEAEQIQKENVIIRAQKKEIEIKNIQLQHTIDELTRTRVSRKAKTITLIIAVFLFIIEDLLIHSAAPLYDDRNYFIAMSIRGLIILSLKPIDKLVENYLLNKILREKTVALEMK
ncbi:MAG: tetratricopeptide repeat protein [Chitinophagales bacterium]